MISYSAWDFLPALSFILYLAGAVACAVSAVWIIRKGDRNRSDRTAAVCAIVMTGTWCATAAAIEPLAPSTQLAESARNLSWIYLLFRLFGNDGRAATMRSVKLVALSLVFVTLLQPVLTVIAWRFAITPSLQELTFQISMLLHMLLAIGALVLLHNLYSGAASQSRQLLRWSALALGGVWSYDLNLFSIAYMSDQAPALLLATRGGTALVLAISLAVGSSKAAAGLHFKPSRAVTFQTLSLLVIGFYLMLMLVIAQSLPFIGGDFGRLAQVGFLIAATLTALLWLPSSRARSWLRVTLTKHLFSHRYDYRNEWLRFTRTIGEGQGGQETLHERAVKAMADVTDSPAGLLLAPNEDGEMELVARWNWPSIQVPAIAASYDLSDLLERENFILDIDALRNGGEFRGERSLVASWLIDEPDVWAVVPLLHFDRLIGAVVLARPVAGRRLDWEDFDLLGVVAKQLASYLSEQAGQQALMEATRFDEFNRRIAFVMHDIKNLASQLSLLARNAEKHAENPEFRADMLVTLRNSADKLNGLLARLGRYGSGAASARDPVDLAQLAEQLVDRFRSVHPVMVTRSECCLAIADVEALDQALVHLLQNAIEATDDDTPVFLEVSIDDLNARIDVVDSGSGMAPGFVRNGLFKPFVSSKDGGFGIGAFEAREIIRAMGGQLAVESVEGLGTRFSIRLPLHAATGISADNSAHSKSEVA